MIIVLCANIFVLKAKQGFVFLKNDSAAVMLY